MSKISVVINTKNEKKNLPRVLASVKDLADEIIIVDMFSTDNTVAIAKKAGARIYTHPTTGYVEPARNFAISKATGEWILVLDADEEVGAELGRRLRKTATAESSVSFYRLPRKNINFGRWIRHSRWWPDYNIRFFKKGSVVWSEIIHSVPETHGRGIDLDAKEKNALIHYNYSSVTQYLERLSNYTSIQAKFLVSGGYKFSWPDLLRKPASEFVSRFFAGEGFKDGVHGLVLCILQAFSEFVVHVKVWEMDRFKEIPLAEREIESEITKIEGELDYWLERTGMRSRRVFTRILRKIFK